MTREEAIKVLEMFLHKQCDLERTKFAYDANTVWEAVNMASKALEQMPCEDATNGEVLLKMFPPSVYYGYGYNEKHFAILAKDCEFICSNDEWWNAPYKAESEEE